MVVELCLNLIKFCEMPARVPEKLDTYMTQSLLEDHPRSTGEDPTLQTFQWLERIVRARLQSLELPRS